MVFDENSKNEEIFASLCKNLLDEAFHGINSDFCDFSFKISIKFDKSMYIRLWTDFFRQDLHNERYFRENCVFCYFLIFPRKQREYGFDSQDDILHFLKITRGKNIEFSVFFTIFFLHKTDGISVELKVSYLEIYNESINDLLNKENNNLDIRENLSKGIYIQNLSEIPVKNENDALEFL